MTNVSLSIKTVSKMIFMGKPNMFKTNQNYQYAVIYKKNSKKKKVYFAI